MPVMSAVAEWEERVIRIGVKAGDHDVLATVRGELAVHPTLCSCGAIHAAFTLTHVRTGLALRKDLSREEAFRLAETVKILDWNFDRVENMPEQTKFAARGAVRMFGPWRGL